MVERFPWILIFPESLSPESINRGFFWAPLMDPHISITGYMGQILGMKHPWSIHDTNCSICKQWGPYGPWTHPHARDEVPPISYQLPIVPPPGRHFFSERNQLHKPKSREIISAKSSFLLASGKHSQFAIENGPVESSWIYPLIMVICHRFLYVYQVILSDFPTPLTPWTPGIPWPKSIKRKTSCTLLTTFHERSQRGSRGEFQWFCAEMLDVF